jgi:hypothetical protein
MDQVTRIIKHSWAAQHNMTYDRMINITRSVMISQFWMIISSVICVLLDAEHFFFCGPLFKGPSQFWSELLIFLLSSSSFTVIQNPRRGCHRVSNFCKGAKSKINIRIPIKKNSGTLPPTTMTFLEGLFQKFS